MLPFSGTFLVPGGWLLCPGTFLHHGPLTRTCHQRSVRPRMFLWRGKSTLPLHLCRGVAGRHGNYKKQHWHRPCQVPLFLSLYFCFVFQRLQGSQGEAGSPRTFQTNRGKKEKMGSETVSYFCLACQMLQGDWAELGSPRLRCLC